MTPRLPDEGKLLNEKLSHHERSAEFGPFRAVLGQQVPFVPSRTRRARTGPVSVQVLANGKGTLPDRFTDGTSIVLRSVSFFLHNSVEARQPKVAVAVKTMPKRNGDSGDTEVEVKVEIEAPPTAPEAERSHVRLVAGDPPMLRLEINLYSWERGDSDIQVVLPHGGELSDLLQWALPEQRLVICGNLRARIHEELAEVFNVLQKSSG